jgi:hypothetical protein
MDTLPLRRSHNLDMPTMQVRGTRTTARTRLQATQRARVAGWPDQAFSGAVGLVSRRSQSVSVLLTAFWH